MVPCPPRRLQQLVYEKEARLRMIMKMHGLPDTAYWLVAYAWHYAVYAAGIFVFMVLGSAVGLQYFVRNSYGARRVRGSARVQAAATARRACSLSAVVLCVLEGARGCSALARAGPTGAV